MAKKKNLKRTGLSDAVYGKKSVSKGIQKTNPFEVHVNRQKYAVLNRDTKADRGLPGVSRAKAAKRRQETLGTELNQMHKSNKFKDNRLTGTRFKTGDDLATAKFAKEMMSRFESKTSKRKGLFNLNEDEDGEEADLPKQMLTHKGQTLKEIEQFHDAVSDGEDDQEVDDMLNAEFTDAAHFGGGGENDHRSRKDMIDELISETKRRKAEAAKEKDQVQNMTEKLDENWKTLIPLMGKLTRTDEVRVKPDAYDKTMREMIFERRGEPTDKLKSKEELAAKEREKAAKLERERLQRMKDESDDTRPTHRSADDLDDDFYLEEDVNGTEDAKVWGQKSEEEVDDDQGSDDDDEEEEDGEDEESDDDEDDLEDLKSSEDEDEEMKNPIKKSNSKAKKSNGTNEKIETLQFDFEIPDTYEELSAVLHGKSAMEQFTIVDKIIKGNPESVDAGNKDKLIGFQAFLCQYINDLFDSDDITEENLKRSFEVFDKLSPLMISLAEINPMAAGNLLREILKEKQDDFQKSRKIPSLEVFMFIKLIDRLFSTSDFKHGVGTPSLLFISQILTRSPVESGRDVARGLFLVTIALDYTAQSKRFLPAVIVFLDAVFRLAVPKKTVEVLRILSLFKNAPSLSPADGKKDKSASKELRLTAKDLIYSGELDESFRHRIINTATLLALRFFDQIQDNHVSMYYAQDLLKIVGGDRLNMDKYPEALKENLKTLQDRLAQLQDRKLTPIRLANKPVQMLRMLEPKFEVEQYKDRRRKSGKPTGKSLQEAMRHKVKREMKGALRDIKLDNAFLAKARLDKQRVLDRERKEKVKRIFAEASIQQGELNAIDRQNKKKKK